MSHIFSKKLIRETILVFREEDNIELSLEQANEYLDSLGGLFLAFANHKETPHDTLSVGGVSSDLISPHSCNN